MIKRKFKQCEECKEYILQFYNCDVCKLKNGVKGKGKKK
jgi:hypothetical protein